MQHHRPVSIAAMAARRVFADDRDLARAAERVLKSHELVNAAAGEQSSEADIRRAVTDLLIAGGLADPDEIRLEADRNDIRTGDLIIEVKKRIGAGAQPDIENVKQLDRYLQSARAQGETERLGVLTDGKHTILHVLGDSAPRTDPSRAFTLRSVDGVVDLIEWLESQTQAMTVRSQAPTEAAVAQAFASSLSAESFVRELADLHNSQRSDPSVSVKQELWHSLLAAALGEAVNDETDLDRLFVRHTYLSTIVALAVHATFGIDIRQRPAAGLIDGTAFFTETGVRGVIESDFFGWPAETDEGRDWIAGLARRVARFDWTTADYDVARVLYQTVIGAEDRRRLGEYYTPDWLASAVVEEVVDDPLHQRVLDPACGSGTFLRAAIVAYVERAEAQGLSADEALRGLRHSVVGIDVHPVAVHLARATWVLAAKSLIREARSVADLTVPVYLGDSLQLLADPGSLFAADDVTIEVKPSARGGPHRFLHFPKALVAQGDWFDALMLGAARDVAAGLDASTTLDDAGIPHGPERRKLEAALGVLAELHAEGRDHIWAYYTRNLVRPAWLSTEEGRVDRVVGNPPWLTFSRSEATVREELQRQSKSVYKIWVGGKYAPHQDVAGLFMVRAVDLYLRGGGRCGMVLPHSALLSGQYERWRTGKWGCVHADLSTRPWDLEQIDPNTFFPITACVAFATKCSQADAAAMPDVAWQWLGPEGGPNKQQAASVGRPAAGGESPYQQRAAQGATIVPRVLFFVNREESPTAIARGIVKVSPRRSGFEKPPWRDVDLPQQMFDSLEEAHVHCVHRGDTVAPFLLLEPWQAALPLLRDDDPPWSQESDAIAGVRPGSLKARMRARWSAMDALWDEHKSRNTTLSLRERLDYHRELSRQLGRFPIRLLYTTSGRPTAAVLTDSEPLVDSTLYWMVCDSLSEAFYLAAVINSSALAAAVAPLMPTGQYGNRHLHKHHWKLPIPAYDDDNEFHRSLASAGSQLADQAAGELDRLRRDRGTDAQPASVAVVRRRLRDRLAVCEVSREAEARVEMLLASAC